MYKDLWARILDIWLDLFYTGVMVDWMIASYIRRGKIKVTDFNPSLINPASLDIRLGPVMKTVTGEAVGPNNIIDPLNKESIIEKQVNGGEGVTYYLAPNSFIIASMHEDITLPPNICAKVVGKSSIGRLGLSNSDCAGFVDQSWAGVLTMELFNHSNDSYIKLTPGMKIGQLLFFKTAKPRRGYDQTGRYQGQKPGQGSLGVG